MGGEIVVKVGEYSLCNIAHSNSLIVILRSGNGQIDINHVVGEERGKDDKRCSLKLSIATEEIIHHHHSYKRIIAGVAKVHQLTKPMPRHGLMEQ